MTPSVPSVSLGFITCKVRERFVWESPMVLLKAVSGAVEVEQVYSSHMLSDGGERAGGREFLGKSLIKHQAMDCCIYPLNKAMCSVPPSCL